MPRALAPDVDRDLIAAVADLADPFARYGIAILRGTGIRLGELLDLELDCLWDFASKGTWVKVPLGKLGTERTVSLDEPTLAAFDAWMAKRGAPRALGASLWAIRLAGRPAAGLHGPDGMPLRVMPHQLRHNYGTALVNAGMSSSADVPHGPRFSRDDVALRI